MQERKNKTNKKKDNRTDGISNWISSVWIAFRIFVQLCLPQIAINWNWLKKESRKWKQVIWFANI